MPKRKRLLVCGASVRHILSIAAPCNFHIIAADQFLDHDTAKLAHESIKVLSLKQLAELSTSIDYDAVVLGGGMENLPTELGQICKSQLPCHNLEALHHLRSPTILSNLIGNNQNFSTANILFPKILHRLPENAKSNTWISKPTNRAGGLGIKKVSPTRLLEPDQYAQQFIDGLPVGALFLANGSTARLLGTNESLSGMVEFGSNGFTYCGSIVPSPVNEVIGQKIALAGQLFTHSFGLKGIFGVDVIVEQPTRDQSRIWVLEINPRITASAELIQRNITANLIALHVDALQDPDFDMAKCELSANIQRAAGKAVLYKRTDQRITRSAWATIYDWKTNSLTASGSPCELLDVPIQDASSANIPKGSPLLTIIASAQTKTAVKDNLLRLAAEVYRVLEQ